MVGSTWVRMKMSWLVARVSPLQATERNAEFAKFSFLFGLTQLSTTQLGHKKHAGNQSRLLIFFWRPLYICNTLCGNWKVRVCCFSGRLYVSAMMHSDERKVVTRPRPCISSVFGVSGRTYILHAWTVRQPRTCAYVVQPARVDIQTFSRPSTSRRSRSNRKMKSSNIPG
jgi:hypothetical protein